MLQTVREFEDQPEFLSDDPHALLERDGTSAPENILARILRGAGSEPSGSIDSGSGGGSPGIRGLLLRIYAASETLLEFQRISRRLEDELYEARQREGETRRQMAQLEDDLEAERGEALRLKTSLTTANLRIREKELALSKAESDLQLVRLAVEQAFVADRNAPASAAQAA